MWLWAVGCGPTPAVDSGTGEKADGSPTIEEDPECNPPLSLDWETWGRGFFRTWCAGCHAASTPDRHGAPEEYTFDTEAQVYAQRDIILWSVIDEARMPLGGGVSPEDQELLKHYLNCVMN